MKRSVGSQMLLQLNEKERHEAMAYLATDLHPKYMPVVAMNMAWQQVTQEEKESLDARTLELLQRMGHWTECVPTYQTIFERYVKQQFLSFEERISIVKGEEPEGQRGVFILTKRFVARALQVMNATVIPFQDYDQMEDREKEWANDFAKVQMVEQRKTPGGLPEIRVLEYPDGEVEEVLSADRTAALLFPNPTSRYPARNTGTKEQLKSYHDIMSGRYVYLVKLLDDTNVEISREAEEKLRSLPPAFAQWQDSTARPLVLQAQQRGCVPMTAEEYVLKSMALGSVYVMALERYLRACHIVGERQLGRPIPTDAVSFSTAKATISHMMCTPDFYRAVKRLVDRTVSEMPPVTVVWKRFLTSTFQVQHGSRAEAELAAYDLVRASGGHIDCSIASISCQSNPFPQEIMASVAAFLPAQSPPHPTGSLIETSPPPVRAPNAVMPPVLTDVRRVIPAVKVSGTLDRTLLPPHQTDIPPPPANPPPLSTWRMKKIVRPRWRL